MPSKILRPEIQRFIKENQHSDLHKLLLKKSPFQGVTMQEIAQQIKGRKVAEKKFPFLDRENIIFPLGISLEQASSQSTAEYKSQFLSGEKFLDLTCGFGIDAWFLSSHFEEVILIERSEDLIKIVAHNWEILGRKAHFINHNLEDFLEQNTKKFSCIYLDPARRDANRNKVFLLEDLSPNLLEIQEKLLNISDEIIVKLSPLIDLKYLLSVLSGVSKIEILAVKNEVKETLVCINSKLKNEKILCKCVNLETQEPDFQFYFGDEMAMEIQFSEPEKFIYIPNNAILKSGAFGILAQKFNLKKLHRNTHLFTSSQWIDNFPGRTFEMEIIDNKQITKGEKFNIISKNHPLKPEDIKKKYKLVDGGNRYLIFTQSQKGKIILKSN